MTSETPRIEYTEHARRRMSEMNVSEAEVESALLYPMNKTWNSKHGTVVYHARRIMVPVWDKPEGLLLVATVLWPTSDLFELLSPGRGRHGVHRDTMQR